jgi:multiple sugar transport system permease protein
MNFKQILRYILLIIVALWTLGPVVWMISLSLKPPAEWYSANIIPKKLILDNYINLFNSSVPIGGTYFMTSIAEAITVPYINSLIIASISTVFAVLIGFCTAYGVSRYKAGGTFTLFFTLLTRMLPGATFVAPLLVYYSTFNLIDTHLGLILLYAAVTLTYAIWILKGYLDEIPPEWEEAALLEGAAPWTVITHVTFPLIRGGILASALFIFILNWTEFLFALVLSVTKAITLPVQISLYASAVGRMYGSQAACGLIATIPMVILGYTIQRYLVTGFTFGRVR